MIKTYRKKPVVIEAIQWTGSNFDEITKFCPVTKYDGKTITITTLEGVMTVGLHSFIIKGIQGEFYACKPDIFIATYESY